MRDADWSLVTAARESGGRVTQSQLAALGLDEGLEETISALSRLGYHFTTTARGTLVLEAWPRRIFSEEIAHALKTDVIGRKVETHWSATSTNDLARSEAAKRREGTVIFAEEQTKGRGRFGRVWSAPRFSSLLFSVAVSCESLPLPADALALAGAVAVAEAIASVTHLRALIRWPNDVLIDDRKVSGILVEDLGAGKDGRWLVMGVGVNVNIDPAGMPPEIARTAGSLLQCLARTVDRALLARAILRRLDMWWEAVKAGDAARLSENCRRLSSILGTFVTLESGGKRHSGRVVDIDVEHGLVLQLSGGPTRVFAPGGTTLIHSESQ